MHKGCFFSQNKPEKLLKIENQVKYVEEFIPVLGPFFTGV
jgi:hypothetical protein